jgi:hypothetical protein
MRYYRPAINEEHIEQIKSLIQSNPSWHRTKLSQELCRQWGWQSYSGQLKDISCRDMLRELDKAGTISLPPALRTTRTRGKGADKVKHLDHNTAVIEVDLRELMPLQLVLVEEKEDNEEFKSYIDQYHYLGYDRSIGENIRYFVTSQSGIVVACLMFSSSAWSCRARDDYIGWTREQRQSSLHLVTNNSRFLIFPWIRVPHLASHILAKTARRISGDFQAKYGHPILLLETFVEQGRFRGTCYQASNWLHVGSTTGRGRDSKTTKATLPLKDVWLYPVNPKVLTKLRSI